MTEAMQAEFDTVAEWTAQVAADLGPEYHVPAGCRGSGSPGKVASNVATPTYLSPDPNWSTAVRSSGLFMKLT